MKWIRHSYTDSHVGKGTIIQRHSSPDHLYKAAAERDKTYPLPSPP